MVKKLENLSSPEPRKFCYKHIYFKTVCTTYNMIIVTIQSLRIGTEAHGAYLFFLLRDILYMLSSYISENYY